MNLEQIKKWQKEHPERVKEINKKSTEKWRKNNRKKCIQKVLSWQKLNVEKVRQIRQKRDWKKRNIKNDNGEFFTKEDYEKLHQQQLGMCAICGRSSKDFKIRLAVDHDHATGVARGLLCSRCNISLHYIENTFFYKRAKKYLIHYKQKICK